MTESGRDDESSNDVVALPCQYQIGRVLGRGSFSVVKEVVHITTRDVYACKVISKKLMEDKAEVVRNEVAVLQKVSSGHQHIITLHDYFETKRHVYLCFELCTGGELLDWIGAMDAYHEPDAIKLVRTVVDAVKYLHICGIVHRDLKPQNLVVHQRNGGAHVMITDFGLSRILEGHELYLLKDICGTPGYMAPEIWSRSGYGKAVDIWAIGVITYHLLAGYTPFDRASTRERMKETIAGEFHFEPPEYWISISDTAKNFITACLISSITVRPTAEQALKLGWLSSDADHYIADPSRGDSSPSDLLPQIRKASRARVKWHSVAITNLHRHIRVAEHWVDLTEEDVKSSNQRLKKLVEEAEKEDLEHTQIIHHFNGISNPENQREKERRAREFMDDEERKVQEQAKGKTA